MPFTIQGEPVSSLAFDDVIAQLVKMPSGFKERTRVQSSFQYNLDTSTLAGSLEQKAYNAFNSGNIAENIEYHREAAQAYEKEGKFTEQGNNLSMAGQACLNLNDMLEGKPACEQAIPLLQKAVQVHEKLGKTDFAFRDIDFLYAALCKTIVHYLGTKNPVQKKYIGMLPALQEQTLLLSHHMQAGGLIDVKAKRIEEGEAGFSHKTRIGTDNISECVTIIARDPVSKKTGIVHLNYESETQSLDAFFKRFGNRKLQVRLIGARFDSNPRSHKNLENVLSYLASKNVDIISADILGGYAEPSAVVVDPATFTVEEKIPGKPNANFDVSNAAVLLADYKKHPAKPLTIQFDITVDPHRLPVFLDADSLAIFRDHYQGKNDIELQQALVANNLVDHALATHYLKGFASAYNTAWQTLSDTLEQVISEKHIKNEQAAQARDALQRIGFYIGENADAMNRPIIHAIENTIFTDDTVDTNALYEAARNSKPFDELLARLKSGEADISASGLRRAHGQEPSRVGR